MQETKDAYTYEAFLEERKLTVENYKLVPGVKEQWLAALRSGEYQQGKGQLRRSLMATEGKHTYCCLGVLCDLAAKEGIGGWATYTNEYIGDADTQAERNVPTRQVIAWAFGLERDNVDIPLLQNPLVFTRHPDAGPEQSLAGWNDGGASFEDIANVIEEKL